MAGKFYLLKKGIEKLKNIREKAGKRLQELRRTWNTEFYECIKDIAEHPVVLRMKLYPHHGGTNCYQHCMNVAYYNYQWCRFLKLDARSAARAGMLHDLFLYDWHTHAAKTGDHFHGMTHPQVSLKNAKKFFQLNKIETDIICTHMWPVTLFSIPHTKEGWITTLTDKYCGSCETSRRKNADTTRIRRDLGRVVERFSYLADIKR